MRIPLLTLTLGVITLWLLNPGTLFAQTAEELRVESIDGVTLVGTLYLPKGRGPFPALIFTHGSEPGDRTHQGYLRWAESVRAHGIAGLIFDKRGVGESEGVYEEAPDLRLPAQDVLAWVDLLKTREDLRSDAIGVLGWSQGGWVGPLAASQSRDLAFVVAISGPGVSPMEQNIYDKTNQFHTAGLPPLHVAQAGRVVRLVLSYLVTGEGREDAQAAWDSVSAASWFTDHYAGPPMMDRETLLQHPRGKNIAVHNQFDPVSVLERIQVPMLAVFGGADRIVPVDVSIKNMREAFERSGNPNFTYKVFPDADHGIRVRDPNGKSLFAPGYPDYVLDWLLRVISR